ncbi:hypothetical protein CLV56_3087 [Mumia flava]|uniref:Uncharacterized protein n=1 Tax=Mumia flava TaxID=1348852 RepID=A0A0B2B8W3_9ACTN|nr:hypothetical protein [Mumia flava]PJJ53597.1 hypothetical protein CLV56_3087 [Mumia flava]
MTATTLPYDAAALDRRTTLLSGVSAFVGTWRVGRYFWAIVVAITIAVLYLTDRYGEVEGTVADGILGSEKIFLGVMGIIIPLAMLSLHLAAGGTRRALFRGLLGAGVALAVTFAMAGAAGMLVESLVADAAGWPGSVQDARLYDEAGDFFAIVLSWSLSGLAYFLGGATVGIAYSRWGPFRGTVVLVPMIAAVAAVEVMLGGGALGPVFTQMADQTAGVVAVAVSVVIIAVLAVVLHRTIRDVPIRTGAPGDG